MPGSRYHNFNDFFGFPDPLKQEDLYDQALAPLDHAELSQAKGLFQLIRQSDRLLHFPYQKYDYVAALIDEAIEDPQVHTIRITLYRVSSKSAIVSRLLMALAAGKQVEAFIEAKARFDEASNLYWGNALTEAGGQVHYSFPGIKVHSKLLLIETHDAPNIAYIGTGNFNEKTARLYCDHALLTADERLTNDTLQVFEMLQEKIKEPGTVHLLVAPFNLRDRLIEKIDREIMHADAGRAAFIFLKMNLIPYT